MDIRFLVPLMVFFAGAYFIVRLGAQLIKTERRTCEKNSFSFEKLGTLTLALAGTLGVGNIFGVATALIIGGAGSVLWLLISSLFAAVIKYAEVTLSLSYGEGGGMIAVLKKSFGRSGKALSSLYALGAIILGAVMGFALQGGSFAECVYVSFGIPPFLSAVSMICILLWIVSGNEGKIKKFTATIIPLTTIVYIIISFWMILQNSERLPQVINMMFKDAFTLDSGIGGILGFITSSRVREGFCGGILSNEAGAGTSSFAHTSGGDIGGVGGILEVLFDTVILCMLTSFATLCALPDFNTYSSGVELILSAVYSVFGGGGIGAVCLIAFSFAICTAACWYYYSSECVRVLFGKAYGRLTLTVMALCILIGSYTDGKYLVVASHYLLLLLSTLSLAALIKNSDKVIKLTLSERRVISKSKRENGRTARQKLRRNEKQKSNITKDGFSSLKRRHVKKAHKAGKLSSPRQASHSQT